MSSAAVKIGDYVKLTPKAIKELVKDCEFFYRIIDFPKSAKVLDIKGNICVLSKKFSCMNTDDSNEIHINWLTQSIVDLRKEKLNKINESN